MIWFIVAANLADSAPWEASSASFAFRFSSACWMTWLTPSSDANMPRSCSRNTASRSAIGILFRHLRQTYLVGELDGT